MHTLYISYFGLREPLVQTQVLPYLRELRKGGVETSLLTFEPRMRREWPAALRGSQRAELLRDGVRWHALAYHKSPSLPATLFDVAAGTLEAARIVRRHRVDTLHARNHVPCLIGALVKRWTGASLVFDVRGFMAEEYVDAGTWPANGLLFRLTKAVERRLMDASDGFVVLTERARDVLFPGRIDRDARGRPFEVIPCCIDVDRFDRRRDSSRTTTRRTLGVEGRRVVVYVGTLGGWYMTDEMAAFLAEAHRRNPATFALILTQSPVDAIGDALRSLGVPESAFLVQKATPGEIPGYLAAADVALSFIRPSVSKLSSSPTKIAEYLAAGLPVVSSAGVGDVDAVIRDDRTGVLVREFAPSSFRAALDELDELRRDPSLADRCRASARRRFDLSSIGGLRYRRLYRRLRPAPTAARSRAASSVLEVAERSS